MTKSEMIAEIQKDEEIYGFTRHRISELQTKTKEQ